MYTTLRALWRPYSKRPWLAAVVIAMCAIGFGVGRGMPVLYKHFADGLASGQMDWFSAYLIAGLATGTFVTWRVYDFFAFRAKTAASVDAYTHGFHYLLRHSFRFFSNEFSGSLIKRVNMYAGAVERFMDFGFQLVAIPVTVAVTGTALFWLHWAVGTAFLVWVAALAGLSIWFNAGNQKYRLEAEKRRTTLSGAVADSVGNAPTVLAFGAWDLEQERFGERLGQWREASTDSWRRFNKVWGVMSFLRLVSTVGSLGACIWLYQRGLATAGTAVMVFSYAQILVDLSFNLYGAVQQAFNLDSDAREMLDVLALPHEITDKPGARPLLADKGAVEFRGVTFAYPDGKNVFEKLDIKIKPGEKVAFVGESGAGKSSLTRLLLRFYDPQEGAVLIDGQDVSRVTQESLRASVSLVPQDPLLFHRSLADNIAYGRPGATREQVERAGKLARCDLFAKNFPHGYDTLVGERGVKLSGGERQRVAVARAILKAAPVLVLDEPTSALDSESERLIQESLDEATRGKTAIVIAHRLSTVMRADRIIVMERGKVVEEGTHARLSVKPGGLYARLWKLQSGGYLPQDSGAQKAA